jgi:hypothetical protein
MSKAGDDVDEVPPPPPKGDFSGGKTTPVVGTPMGSQVEQLSSELIQLKLQRKIDKQKRSLKILNVGNWLLPLHQIKKPMIHPKKISRAKEEVREIRDPTKLLSLTMIICLLLTPSPWYQLVKPPFRWDWLYQMVIHNEGASNLA